ncbi:MAG: polysaccharide biosynthesis/export family protein [Opitutaceae bacterium]
MKKLILATQLGLHCVLLLLVSPIKLDAESLIDPQTTISQTRYKISKFDTISVTVYQQTDLSTSQRVSEAGTITMPLIGEISVERQTTQEAQKTIAKKFIDEEYLVAPVVTVNIDAFSPRTITVLGEVNSPGQITLPDSVDSIQIQDLLAMVGDFADIAKKDAVRIERPQPNGAPSKIVILDVESILEAKPSESSSNPTFYVEAGDIIFVPRRVF